MLQSGPEYWDSIAKKELGKSSQNKILAEHKKRTHLSLIARWAGTEINGRTLKTDLFEEASGADQLLFDLSNGDGNLIGIDISREIVLRAKTEAGNRGIGTIRFICCDVRHIPLRDNSIDLIISDSTLDHYPSKIDIFAALSELSRVLHVGGVLIVTLDNKSNLTYPPYIFMRLWMKIGLSRYFIGRTLTHKELKHALEEIGLSVEESTAIFHRPHPDALVRILEHSLHTIGRGKLDNAIRKVLDLTDKLETKRTKYLTGSFIAVKAVKREVA